MFLIRKLIRNTIKCLIIGIREIRSKINLYQLQNFLVVERLKPIIKKVIPCITKISTPEIKIFVITMPNEPFQKDSLTLIPILLTKTSEIDYTLIEITKINNNCKNLAIKNASLLILLF